MHIHVIQHVTFEGPGVIEEIAREEAYSISFTRFYETYRLPEIDSFDLLIVMGGPMNIYDEEKYPWLAEEKAFLRRCRDEKKKMLGICLGAQLLADTLGSRIYPNIEKEIGWFPITPHPKGEHELLRLLPGDQPAFHWHGDTFDLPDGAIPLFTSKATKIQGFIKDNRWLGLQFHWEVQPRSVASLLQYAKSDLTPGNYVQSDHDMLSETAHFQIMKKNLKILLSFLHKKTSE